MAKRCPLRCGTYSDDVRRCPVCNSFLLKIPDQSGNDQGETVPPIYRPQPQGQPQPVTLDTQTPPITPPNTPTRPANQDYYPMKQPPKVQGRIKNLISRPAPRSKISKFFDSLLFGVPYYSGDTINTFQVFSLDNQGRETHCTQVVIGGDIMDGELYNGNEVRVWGNSSGSGSVRAKKVYNITSSIIVRVKAVPSGALRVLIFVLLAGILFLIMNRAILSNFAPYLLIGGGIIIAIRIIILRLTRPRIYRRW